MRNREDRLGLWGTIGLVLAGLLVGACAVPPGRATPTNPPGLTVYTDRQFAYEMRLPRDWGVTTLKGNRLGLGEWPVGSVWISNVATPSLQDPPPGAGFVIAVYAQPVASEEAVLAQIARLLVAQPGDVLRRAQGDAIEFYTARTVRDPFGRPTMGRWFWRSRRNLLSVVVLILDPTTPHMRQLEDALGSVRLLGS